MSLATARTELAKALRSHLGRTWSLFPDAATIDTTLTRPTLQLWRSSVAPHPAAPRSGRRRSTFSLQLIMPTDTSDDTLEERLEELLDAVDKTTSIVWDTAERGVWESACPAYTITFTTTTE